VDGLGCGLQCFAFGPRLAQARGEFADLFGRLLFAQLDAVQELLDDGVGHHTFRRRAGAPESVVHVLNSRSRAQDNRHGRVRPSFSPPSCSPPSSPRTPPACEGSARPRSSIHFATTKAWDDQGFKNQFVEHAAALGIDAEGVTGNPSERSFRVLERRWVVKRTIGWLMLHRRLAREYEGRPAGPEAMIHLATIDNASKRITDETTPTWRGTY